ILSVCPVIPIQSLKKSQQRLTSYLGAADRKLQLYNCSTRGSIGARSRLQVRAACGNDGRLQQRRSSLQLTVLLVGAGLTTLHPDRKSTRLNSSHLGISYAVFCL